MICSRLDLPGGTERAVANTSALLANSGYKITLLILDETKESFYLIHKDISIIQEPLFFDITDKGNWLSRKFSFLKDLAAFKRILKDLNPQVVITTEYHFSIVAVLSGIKSTARVLSWEHHHFYELKRNSFWRILYKKFYPQLDGIIALNKDEESLFKKINRTTRVIPNFITIQDRSVTRYHHEKMILTIVRLNRVKGMDLLLQMAKIILNKYPDWKWKLIGQGEMKDAVIHFIDSENLKDQLLYFPPENDKVFKNYIKSSFFVLPSRHECFPMVLLEAMSSGLPCVAFDCETGPRDIITNGVDGFLIEKGNMMKMIEAIEKMIENREERLKMGENAYQSIQRFSPEAILGLWKQVIDQ